MAVGDSRNAAGGLVRLMVGAACGIGGDTHLRVAIVESQTYPLSMSFADAAREMMEYVPHGGSAAVGPRCSRHAERALRVRNADSGVVLLLPREDHPHAFHFDIVRRLDHEAIFRGELNIAKIQGVLGGRRVIEIEFYRIAAGTSDFPSSFYC